MGFRLWGFVCVVLFVFWVVCLLCAGLVWVLVLFLLCFPLVLVSLMWTCVVCLFGVYVGFWVVYLFCFVSYCLLGLRALGFVYCFSFCLLFCFVFRCLAVGVRFVFLFGFLVLLRVSI